MTSSGKHYDNIVQRLSAFESNVKRSSQLGRTNINKDAERLFCYPLELLFDGRFINLNTVEANYPAVDLGCREQRISVQVTSDNEHDKIQSTLNKFFLHGKDQDFDRLIVLIIGERKHYRSSKDTKQAKFPPFELKGKLDFDPDRDIWGTVELLQQIDGLSPEKMEALSDFLDSQLESTGALRPYLYLPPRSAVGNGFVGREKELADIQMELNSGRKPVILSGLGGMGKTELAARFARNYSEGQVYFARFQDSFTQTLRAMFTGVLPQPSQLPSEQEQSDTVLDLLNRCTQKDLLIIDNVDADSGTLADLMHDKVFAKLQKMRIQLILTTRFECSGSVKIEPLKQEDLIQIFRRHHAVINTDAMLSLIRAVSGHTLSIDLIARTLADNWVPVSPEEMLAALDSNNLPDADFAEIDSDYSGSPDQKQIYQHLRAVFNVAKIPEAEKAILHYATLLPNDGMDLRLFRSCISRDLLKVFPRLGKRGWLISDGSVLQIHPVIRLICRKELNPTDSSCHKFLHAVWKNYDGMIYNADMFRQFAELFSCAADTLPDAQGDKTISAGTFWYKIGQPLQAIRYYERGVKILEDCLPNSRKLATAYDKLGSACSLLGNHSDALKYQLECVNIRTRFLPPDHPLIAKSYSNVGLVYSHMHDYSQALKYQLDALEIRKKALRNDNPALASSYHNVGKLYRKLEDYTLAMEYLQKALKLRLDMFPLYHPSVASSYQQLSKIYSAQGDHEKALEYLQIALDIRKAVLPPGHPDLGLSFNNVGCTYCQLGQHAQALTHQLKGLEIFELTLPPKHPYITYVCQDLSRTYSLMGEDEKAAEFLAKAGLHD